MSLQTGNGAGKAPYRVVGVTHENLDDFIELVREQAAHHASQYVGDSNQFLGEITDPSSPANVFAIEDTQTGRMSGYVLYNLIQSQKGREFYIEDILVSGAERSRGAGRFLFDHAKALARKENCDCISWVVARDNDRAIKFYTEKINAKPSHLVGYDCNRSLSSGFNVHSEGVIIRELTAADRNELIRLCKGDKVISFDDCSNLFQAASQPHSNAMMAVNASGKPLAFMIANSNYSSFRTVYGYKAEFIEIPGAGNDALHAFGPLANALVRRARENNHQGHLNVFIDPRSDAQALFIKTVGGEPFMMSENPNSFLDLYTIGRAEIHNVCKNLVGLRGVTAVDSFAPPGRFEIA